MRRKEWKREKGKDIAVGKKIGKNSRPVIE